MKNKKEILEEVLVELEKRTYIHSKDAVNLFVHIDDSDYFATLYRLDKSGEIEALHFSIVYKKANDNFIDAKTKLSLFGVKKEFKGEEGLLKIMYFSSKANIHRSNDHFNGGVFFMDTKCANEYGLMKPQDRFVEWTSKKIKKDTEISKSTKLVNLKEETKH